MSIGPTFPARPGVQNFFVWPGRPGINVLQSWYKTTNDLNFISIFRGWPKRKMVILLNMSIVCNFKLLFVNSQNKNIIFDFYTVILKTTY